MKKKNLRLDGEVSSDYPTGQSGNSREALEAIVLWNEAHKLLTALDHMAQKRPELFRVIARQTFY